MHIPSQTPRRLLVVSVILMIGVPFAHGQQDGNLVSNGDFSLTKGSAPVDWETAGDKKDVEQRLDVVKEDGKNVARLTCTRCDHNGPASHAMLCQIGRVALAKGKMYVFSCGMRAEGLGGRSVDVAISDTKSWSNCGLSDNLAVGPQWQTFRRVFTASGAVSEASRLQIWYGEKGTIYVADVRIKEFSPEQVEKTDVVPPGTSSNLIFNGSFELGACGWSSCGEHVGWGNLTHLHGTIETSGGSDGKCFLRVPLGGKDTPVLYFDWFDPVVRRELRPLAANRGWIKVDSGQPYTLSCDMRASADGAPAVLSASYMNAADAYEKSGQKTVTLTGKWARYSFTFWPQGSYVCVKVGPSLAKEQTVTVDIDAVQLEKGRQASRYCPRREVEWGLTPSEPGGIFIQGQRPSLLLQAFNASMKTIKARLNLQVTDYADKPVAMDGVDIDLPPGAVAKTVELPADWLGYYCIRAALAGTDKSETARLALAVAPPVAAKDSVVGINHAFADAYLIRQASKAGITWYRDWTLKWQNIEPQKGQYRWDVGDQQIDRVLAEGVNVLPLLPSAPSAEWASELAGDSPAGTEAEHERRQSAAPRNPAEMGEFIGKAVAHFKDRIHVYEFLNEPLYTQYALSPNIRPGKPYKMEDYVSLLQIAGTAMKKADPSCKVIGGIASGPTHLTRQFIDAGGLERVDIFNLHIYPGAKPPEGFVGEMDDLLAMMDRHGGRKPIWITEFSYYASDNPQATLSAHGDFGMHMLDSEKQCADYTLRFLAIMMSRNAQKFFIHSGASGQVNAPSDECALFDYGGAPRKLFAAIAAFNSVMDGAPSPAGSRDLGATAHALAFETPKHAVVVLWQEQDTAGVIATLRQRAEVKPLSTMGRPLGDRVALSPSPVYLIGPSGKAKEMLASLAAQQTGSKP